MRSETSSWGRRQFSELKAKSVTYLTPRRPHASMTRRTACTPLAWPAARGNMRRVAQRPFPSMMMAKCCGTEEVSGMETVELICMASTTGRSPSYGHDLGFFLADHFVNFSHMTVGQLLDFVLHAALVVLGYFFVLDEFLEGVIGLAAQITNGHLGVFTLTTNDFGEIAAAFFSECRHGHTDIVTHGHGIQAQV